MLLFLLTLTCTLNPTPSPKPRLNASSKPKAEHEPSTLTNLALVDRSLIPFNSNLKTQKLKLNPKPQNPTATPQGEERPPHPTPHGRGGPTYIQTIDLWAGAGGGAERVTMYWILPPLNNSWKIAYWYTYKRLLLYGGIQGVRGFFSFGIRASEGA